MLTKGIITWDERRDLIALPGTEEAITFAAEHWIHSAKRAIQHRGFFAVALSGGSTPKAIYERLTKTKEIEWEKIWLFWSDERAVPPDHPDSNYRMAMEAGFKDVPIPPNQIFRMVAEKDLKTAARDYEEKIKHYLGKHLFDLVMLGIGEDGHTASLFPTTAALEITDHLVVSNFAGKEKGHRMTLTFPCINQSNRIAIYALGPAKKNILPKVLEAPIDSPWPASKLGTSEHKALWVIDEPAASLLKK